MYNMISNFYPAAEKKNGYIGKADLTIANAIKIHDISVFENEEGKLHLQFKEYGDHKSFVVPKDKEAYAAILGVIENAIRDEKNHFGYVKGDMSPFLSVHGTLVDGPYADGRFSVDIKDLCVLNGISTREVEHNGKSFTAVNMPVMEPYEKEGKKVYPKLFEGLKVEYEKDGEKISKDYGALITNLIKGERKNLIERKPSIDEQVHTANKTAEKENTAPSQEKEMSAPEPAR